jgi:hypothetical protein
VAEVDGAAAALELVDALDLGHYTSSMRSGRTC